jgi:hypothetical protein
LTVGLTRDHHRAVGACDGPADLDAVRVLQGQAGSRSASRPGGSRRYPGTAAPFRPLMRLYQPQAAILDGTYQIPPITKAAT